MKSNDKDSNKLQVTSNSKGSNKLPVTSNELNTKDSNELQVTSNELNTKDSKNSSLVTRYSSLPSDSSLAARYSLLLLEIGTEEIPARFLPDAIDKLREYSEKIFSEYRLPVTSIKTYATPRRLTLIAEVGASQEAAEREAWGPPVTAAFDKEGTPTKAAEAFAKAQGIPVTDLIRKEKGKGVYVMAVIKEKARDTAAVLPEILPKVVLSLNFPKSMHWGDGSFRFVRPIHWILAIYDNRRVAFEVDGIKSINITRGHRFLAPAPFEIKDSKAYMVTLRNNFVILDPDERKKIIIEGAGKLASSVEASVIQDDELLRQVVFLVEYPVPVLGTFSADYLSLPKELLIIVMKSHQKYFALEDKNGKLTNYFIIVSNTKNDNAGTVKKGAEKVIKARFEDARFYYEEDRKTPLKERVEGLKKVIYHDKLGTVYDKSVRMASIAEFLSSKCLPSKKEDVNTAALLSKADLISGVVREFPELQGVMGHYYALHEGYNEDIAKALAEQYLPRYSGDTLPETETGTIISLSDKLDNLASFFMLGLTPTGTEDPFALRRQAIGILSILSNKRFDLKLTDLFEKALQPFKVKNKEAIVGNLLKFFEQRFEPLFLSGGYAPDEINAVMDFVREKPLYTVRERLDALRAVKEDAGYNPFLLAIKRINNIAPKGETAPVKKELLSEGEEIRLLNEVESAAPHIRSLIRENNYLDALRILMSLKETINSFFDKVLVMDKNEEIKQNRLALIQSIKTLAQEIADFSKLS